MRKKRMICGWLLAFVSFIMAVISPMAVSAADQNNQGQSCSLTLSYQHEEQGIQGADFRIYQVAKVGDDGQYTVTKEFAKASVSMNQKSESEWAAHALTLESHVVQQQAEGNPLKAAASGQTDEEGKLTFSGLEHGLYLVTGEVFQDDNQSHIPQPILVSLPGYEEDGEWNYHPVCLVKKESQMVTVEEETVTLGVVKVWEDAGYEEHRPTSVTVQLFRDGEKYDEVQLSKENNWRYQWEGLDKNARWQLAEADVPEGYTVTVVQDNTYFTVTNTYQPPSEETEIPKTPDQPADPPGQSTKTGGKLPQTGQLWWPVPMLMIMGFVIALLGLSIKRRENYEN